MENKKRKKDPDRTLTQISLKNDHHEKLIVLANRKSQKVGHKVTISAMATEVIEKQLDKTKL